MAKNEFTLLARVSYLEAAHRLRDEMEGEGDLCFLGSPGQLCLLCNDVFAWASADAEPLPENLFDQYAREWIDLSLTDEELQWYAAAWAVRLRQRRPQKAAVDKTPAFPALLRKMGIDIMAMPPGYGW